LVQNVGKDFWVLGLLMDEPEGHEGTSVFVVFGVGRLGRQIGFEETHGLGMVVLVDDP